MNKEEKVKILTEKFKDDIGKEIYSKFTGLGFKIGKKYLLTEIHRTSALFTIDGERVQTHVLNLNFFAHSLLQIKFLISIFFSAL